MRALAWLATCGLWLLSGCARCGGEATEPFRIRGELPPGERGFEVALFQTTGDELRPGHRFEVVDDGAVFDRIAGEIRRAERSVNVVSFIWRAGAASNRLLEALEARREGVACRVLVDPFGSRGFDEDVRPRLEAMGCEARQFRPLPADENLARNHRKLVIVDGRVGVTGGFGIQDQWLGDGDSPKEWRDVNVRVEGPAVGQMQQAFAENWQEATGLLLPATDFPYLGPAPPRCEGEGEGCGQGRAAFVSSTAHPEVTTAERLTQLLVRSATRRLWIAQAYFTPNGPLRELLTERARAGVDVRVLAPGEHNDHPEITALQRARYDELRAAGVRLWEYLPSMMHAKTMLVDDDLVLVGSINYDALSFNLLEEGALLVRDAALAQRMARGFEEDLERSKAIGTGEAKEKPLRAGASPRAQPEAP